MEKTLTDRLPILEVSREGILSKMGDYTVAFELTKPEIFTLSAENYESMHQAWIRAVKVLPQDTVLHMQDWYTQATYRADLDNNELSFLARASERHFDGRSYLAHRSWLFITKRPTGRRVSNSSFSGLLGRNLVPGELLHTNAIREFMDSAEQFARILGEEGLLRLRRLDATEITGDQANTGIIEQYCSLGVPGEPPVIREPAFDPTIRVGDRHTALYTLADLNLLPSACGSRIDYERYSTDKTRFSIGFSSMLGPLLPCNHICNQYIFIGDAQAAIKKLETKRMRLQSLSHNSRHNTLARDAVNDFLDEAIGRQRLPVRAHFNVLAWTDNPTGIKDIKSRVSAAMAQLGAIPHLETVGAAQIWWAGIPGNAADFPMNDCFDTFLEQALCFLNLETNCRSAASGIRFGDRITGRPVWMDLFDAPMREGITSNRNLFVCGGSGGGKSMAINHLLRSLFDQQAHCVTVDIGGSYKGLCKMVGGYYFTYEEDNPIRFNPFYIPPGESLDTEKKESLKALLISLWKADTDSFNRAEYVALSNAIQGFYGRPNDVPATFPCFDSFYEYLNREYIDELKGHGVKDKDFDIGNFLYVLRPFYKGGEFDYLLNARQNLDMLHQRFIVFELDNIKDHPILFPVVTLIIMELFVSKMRKLKGVRKILTIEEAWKAIAKSGMAEFIKYVFKTVRKFNGIAAVVTQEIDDLINSPIIKETIINNADIKILMDMRKFMNKFDQLQATLGLSDKAKTMLLSVNRANDPARKYRELFIDLAGQRMTVLRNELSPEEYFTYTTEEKEKIMVMAYADKHGDMEKGITALVADLNLKAVV